MLRIVQTVNGVVRGLPASDPRITSFKGIPFAAPPVGENRWRAPQPVQSWSGTRDCLEFAPIAMQATPGLSPDSIYDREWHVDSEVRMDEDCLYLNVWTPAKKADEKLPVFVWYFGGGLQVGYPSEMEFDGERIARRGVVVVSCNYRLNAFGFLCHPEITKENPAAPADFGHLDQQAAVRWVQRNIAAFGGDPDNITIGGQSAGGGSVLAQLASPQNFGKGRDLFQKAIVQSGAFTQVYPHNFGPLSGGTLAQAEAQGEDFFHFLGVERLSEARTIPAKELLQKILENGKFWGTVLDGQFCVEEPYDAIREGRGMAAPLLLGNTVDEFPAEPAVQSRDELLKLARDLCGEKSGVFIKTLENAGGATLAGALHAMKRAARVNGLEFAARLLAQGYKARHVESPLYYYEFAADIPGWDNPGCFHSVDIWFFFETLAKCWRPWKGSHYELARQMCNYWANFIRSGDPNGTDADGSALPEWTPFSEDAPSTMVFSNKSECREIAPGAVMKLLLDARKALMK